MSKRIHLLALAGVVGLSLLASACGGSNSDSGGSGSQNNPRLGALVAFSACMRQHGLPNFPDPKAVGHGYGLTIGSENGLDPNSPQFKTAQQACKQLLPNGGQQSSQEQAKQLQTALNYAACIRSHGVPNYPDPKAASGGGIELGEAPDSPQFKTAQKACQHLLPGGGGGTSTSGSGDAG
jgi:hypothetical protein